MEARRLTNVDVKEVRLSSITLSSDRISRDKNCVFGARKRRKLRQADRVQRRRRISCCFPEVSGCSTRGSSEGAAFVAAHLWVLAVYFKCIFYAAASVLCALSLQSYLSLPRLYIDWNEKMSNCGNFKDHSLFVTNWETETRKKYCREMSEIGVF